MKRREFITLASGAVAAWPLIARAQQAERVRRVGIMMPYAKGDTENEARVQALRQELERLGWSDGGNIQFDVRWTTDNMDLVRANAENLMASNPNIVVATGGRVIPILMQLSRSIPIVLPGASDPVGAGYVTSLARPGGNVTGFASFELSMLGKSLETLKEIAPAIVRVALIYNPDNPNTVIYRRILETAAGPLAVEPIAVPIHGLDDIDRALGNLAEQQNAGVFFLPDLTIIGLRNEVVARVAQRSLPAIYSASVFVKIGGLASYAADFTDIYRRAAGYIDRILRGEKPGDLPFQQPTKYQFMINLKTAKALGLTIPQALLATADEVIE